jgi:hypothetical protein
MTNRMEKFQVVGFAAIGLVVATMTSALAFATELGGGGGTPVAVKQIGFDEFKDRCVNPDKYPDIQLAPQHIVMLCESDTLDWVPDQPGSIPLQSTQVIQGAVKSDKFAVAVDSQTNDIPNKGGSCLRFKQIERSLKLEIPAACGDLTKYDSVVQFCQDQASGKGTSGKDVTTKDTGVEIDTCKDFPQK